MNREKVSALLLKNADLYSPEPMGRRDVLILAGKIFQIAQDLQEGALKEALPGLEVLDLQGAIAAPGIIDHHNHFGGAGGEGGFQFRTPPAQLSSFIKAGITGAVGLLGTDGYNRSLEELLAKARGLEAEGLSTWIYTGSYQVPGPTMTGSAGRDICLIDKVIGCKMALSDHRCSHPGTDQIRALVSEVRVSAMLAGKRGVVCVHMGSEVPGLEPLRRALAGSDVPLSQFVPTHVGRTPELTADAVRWVKEGGLADITAGGSGQSLRALEAFIAGGADLSQVMVSSDGNGSMPKFNEKKELVSMAVGDPSTILEMINQGHEAALAPLERLFALTSSNVARWLGLNGKGELKKGFDGDLIVLEPPSLALRHVIAKGQIMMKEGVLLAKGTFEN